jgi:Rrf2 family protein
MAANTRVATAVQILCVIVYRDGATTSEDIANSLATNANVVRRLLRDLERAGFVTLRPGKDGGVTLRVAPGEITLDQVFRAVENDDEIFALRHGGNPRCPVNRSMRRLLSPVFDQVSASVSATLGRTTLADLTAEI